MQRLRQDMEAQVQVRGQCGRRFDLPTSALSETFDACDDRRLLPAAASPLPVSWRLYASPSTPPRRA